MTKTIHILLSGALVFFCQIGFTQDTMNNRVPDDIITITDEYRPKLQKPIKIRFQPELPEASLERVNLTYRIPSRSLNLPFTPTRVRPLAMKRYPLDKIKVFYGEIGVGNAALPYLDFYINSGRKSDKTARRTKRNLGANVYLLNAYNKNIEHQKFNDFRASAFSTFYGRKAGVKFFAKYLNQRDHFYGYDHGAFSFTEDQVRQNYLHGDFAMDIFTMNSYARRWNFDLKAHGFYTQNISKDFEFNPGATIHLRKGLRKEAKMGLKGAFEYNIYQINNQTSTEAYYFTVNPYYEFKVRQLDLHLGLSSGVAENKFYIYPDLRTEQSLYGDGLKMYVGWNAKIKHYNLRELARMNAYVKDSLNLRQSIYQERFTGFYGAPLANFDYDIRFTQRVVNYLPVFIPDQNGDNKKFDIMYDSGVSILNVHAEAGYNFSEKFRLQAGFDFFDYAGQISELNQPSIKFNITSSFNPIEKLNIYLDVFSWNNLKAMDKTGAIVTLPGHLDLNLKTTYKVTKTFNVFLAGYNLTNHKYQRYIDYTSYGINVVGGIISTF